MFHTFCKDVDTTDTLVSYHSLQSSVTTIFSSVITTLKKNEVSLILYCSVLHFYKVALCSIWTCPIHFYYNVPDTVVSHRPPQSFATATLSPETTTLNKEHIFILFSITAWHRVVFGHVPYLLQQRCRHNGYGRLVPSSTVFCNSQPQS